MSDDDLTTYDLLDNVGPDAVEAWLKDRKIALGQRSYDVTELARERARRAARRTVDAEERRERQRTEKPLDVAPMRDVLARPQPHRDRIESLSPWAGSTLITAQRKVGKTTLVCNLVVSLLTGEPFLGQFMVVPVGADRRVAVFNYEVSAEMFARWLDEAGVDPDRVVLVNVRGRANPLADPAARTELAAQLREYDIETVIYDPFGRAFTGENQNDAGQVSAFLMMLDAFTREEIGATDLFLTNHAGWGDGERTRGSSALEDWPDALWRVVKDDQGIRYFSAMGRDVDVEEDALDFDMATRALSLSGIGSRRTARTEARVGRLVAEVARVVREQPGLNTGEVEAALRADGVPMDRGDVSKALKRATDEGLVERRQDGPAKRHYPVVGAGTSREVPA